MRKFINIITESALNEGDAPQFNYTISNGAFLLLTAKNDAAMRALGTKAKEMDGEEAQGFLAMQRNATFFHAGSDEAISAAQLDTWLDGQLNESTLNETGYIHTSRITARLMNAKPRMDRVAAQYLLKDLTALCTQVLEYCANRGEISMAMKKAVMNAKAMFPQDVEMCMTNNNVPRNIRDGIALIRAELKNYNVMLEGKVMEGEDDYPNDPDDGHEHDYVDAEGADTGTDADAVVCKKCGELSAEDDDSLYEEEKYDGSMPGRRGYWMQRRKDLKDAKAKGDQKTADFIEAELKKVGELHEEADDIAQALEEAFEGKPANEIHASDRAVAELFADAFPGFDASHYGVMGAGYFFKNGGYDRGPEALKPDVIERDGVVAKQEDGSVYYWISQGARRKYGA